MSNSIYFNILTIQKTVNFICYDWMPAIYFDIHFKNPTLKKVFDFTIPLIWLIDQNLSVLWKECYVWSLRFEIPRTFFVNHLTLEAKIFFDNTFMKVKCQFIDFAWLICLQYVSNNSSKCFKNMLFLLIKQ